MSSRVPSIASFVAIGAALFAIDSYYAPPVNDPRDIQIGEDVVRAVILKDQRRQGVEPDRARARRLIQDHVDEEILVRRGVELGLDAEDPIIRRRIVQKLRLLADASVEEPNDEVLRALLASYAWMYESEERWQISLRFYGEDGHEAARAAQRAGDVDLGARAIAFGNELGWRGASELEKTFGPGLIARLRADRCTEWCAPVDTEHGVVAFRATGHRPPEMPDFASLRPRLRQRWLNDARHRARSEQVARMRGFYDVTLAWPDELSRLSEGAP